MPTCNLLEIVHNTWLQQFGKKGKDVFDAIVDNLIRALEQQTWYRMHLMGKLKGIKPNQAKLHLKAMQKLGNPKNIVEVIHVLGWLQSKVDQFQRINSP